MQISQLLKHSDDDAMHYLSHRWNHLTSSVEEYMASTAEVKYRIGQIAKVSLCWILMLPSPDRMVAECSLDV